jgi:hypothetical protein
MRAFAELPAADRWSALDRELPAIIARHVKAAEVDPTAEIAVADLAQRHGIGERAMVSRLRQHGGKPYQLGTRWFIRARSYVLVLESVENAAG